MFAISRDTTHFKSSIECFLNKQNKSGAIYAEGNITITGSMFEGNSASVGGSLYGEYAAQSVTSVRNSFMSNRAREAGPAISIEKNESYVGDQNTACYNYVGSDICDGVHFGEFGCHPFEDACIYPSESPSSSPVASPSGAPTLSSSPTNKPTISSSPTLSGAPTVSTSPTASPTVKASEIPSLSPTTLAPTQSPTESPTIACNLDADLGFPQWSDPDQAP